MISTGDAVLESVGLFLESDAGSSAGDNGLNVGHMNSSFLFQPTSLRIFAAAPYVSVDAVYSFNQDTVGFGQKAEDTALLALVVATDNHDDITFFYMDGHKIKPPQKPKK